MRALVASDYPTTLSDWGNQKEPGATRLDLIILLALSFGASAGGYRHLVYQLGGPGGREPSNQLSMERESRTRHSFFWGMIQQNIALENCTLSDGTRTGVEEIKLDSNLAFAFLTSATLGIWSPVKVTWRCARPATPALTIRPSVYPTRFKLAEWASKSPSPDQ